MQGIRCRSRHGPQTLAAPVLRPRLRAKVLQIPQAFICPAGSHVTAPCQTYAAPTPTPNNPTLLSTISKRRPGRTAIVTHAYKDATANLATVVGAGHVALTTSHTTLLIQLPLV